MAVVHSQRQSIAIVVGAPQTSAPVVVETCTPVLGAFDALSVGLSLQTLAHQGRMPAEVSATYRRVGEQLEAAARLAMKGGGQ